jgi:fumarate reductase subunit D
MADAMKQSNCFKLKTNPVNIFVLGVLYSTGLFSTQAVGSTTDITGQTITDGVLLIILTILLILMVVAR